MIFGTHSTAVEGSDWDFGMYYRGGIDPADIAALGWPGRVFAPGEWGQVVNGGAWLTVDGTKVGLIYRDLDEVIPDRPHRDRVLQTGPLVLAADLRAGPEYAP
jgi:hypothetical protein